MFTFTPWIVGLGCVGGLLPDILRLIKNRYDKHLAACFTRGNFWLGVVLMVVIGGLAAWLLKATDAKEAITLGFTAPQVISSLSAAKESAVDRGAGTEFGLRRWWAS
jgi:hypothetical protein